MSLGRSRPAPARIEPYRPQRLPEHSTLMVRGGRLALRRWAGTRPEPVLLLHGWMDCGASYQFMVDCLPAAWSLLALDWRGYGGSENRAEYYWLPDYLADLEHVFEALSPGRPMAVIAHSLGGTVASMYAGVRPERFAWLVNMEGFGLWRSQADAVERIAQWLDEQRELASPARYASLDEFAQRILRAHPRLRADRARFLAQAWTRAHQDEFEIAADPKHRLSAPLRYRSDEIEECWAHIRCPVLMLHGSESDFLARAGGDAALLRWHSRIARLSVAPVAGAGHMLQHEQPELTAQQIVQFASGQA